LLYFFVLIFGIASIIIYERLVLFECQNRFEDKVVFNEDTGKSDLSITQWKKHYWVYLNGLKNVSTIDDYLFYEPFIIPVSGMNLDISRVLVLGGENGCAVRELLKSRDQLSIVLVPYDTGMLQLFCENPILKQFNNHSLHNQNVSIRKMDIIEYVTTDKEKYDLIIIDLPDPRSIVTNQFYSMEFYDFCGKLLRSGGLLVTQSGSPYFTTEAFHAIDVTLQAAGFHTLPLHNQVLTLGEWSWIIGSRDHNRNTLKSMLYNSQFDEKRTRWLNRESLALISSFGKDYIQMDSIYVNTLSNPVTYKYYARGSWDLD
jgi:spermidine synthase